MPVKAGNRRYRWPVATVLLAGLLAACGQGSTTPLPELTPVARPVLTPQEQKRAMAEIEAERDKANSEAVRSIEQQR